MEQNSENSAHRELNIELQRQISDAEKAIQGGQHVDETSGTRFEFTAEQVAAARQEMDVDTLGSTRRVPESGQEIEKLPRIIIEIKGQPVEIPNQALASFAQLLKAKRAIEQHYPELLELLPTGHPWRAAKETHSLLVGSGAPEVFEELRQEMTEENFYLLLLMASSHDFGRPLQVQRKNEAAYKGQHHGDFSVELLARWQVLENFEPVTQQIITYSVTHHADVVTPELARDAGDLEKIEYFYTSALRDLDKIGVFKGKTELYLFDQDEKNKQNTLGGFDGEQNSIQPPELLTEFTEGHMIDRKKCRSYEAYMLQFLAWMFDLNLKDSLHAVVQSGAVGKLLHYFERQLPGTEFQVIRQKTENYLRSHGVAYPVDIVNTKLKTSDS